MLVLPFSVGLWWFWRRQSDPLRGWRNQIAAHLLPALIARHGSGGPNAAWPLLVAWILSIVAISGPTWKLEPNPFSDDATPLMILLKADASMEIADPAPSRLERAKLKIIDLAEARPGQPLGLLAYAGSAHLVLPPTRDTLVVAQMASEISPDIMPTSGDRLDLALLESSRILEKGGHGGSYLVLADFVDTEPEMLDKLRPAVSGSLQIMAINLPQSSEDASVRAAAKLLGARVVPIEIEGNDVVEVIRHAAKTPVAQKGQQGERWQEAGYWLVPLIGLIVLMSFRKEEQS